MCKTQRNSGYLANKSRKMRRRRGGLLDGQDGDRQK